MVEWMVCAVCGAKKNPVYNLRDGPGSRKPTRRYGKHKNFQGKRCPGGSQPPSDVYWGDSVGYTMEDEVTMFKRKYGGLPPGPQLNPAQMELGMQVALHSKISF